MDELTISDLESAAGVPRRTIYFYVQQGILPPPSGAGLAARYHRTHLLRLNAIPRLRQLGWRLDRIRAYFEGASDDELTALLGGQTPGVAFQEPFPHSVGQGPSAESGPAPEARSNIVPAGSDDRSPSVQPPTVARPASPSLLPEAVIRYRLAPGVDLYVQPGLPATLAASLARLLEAAAAIFGQPDDASHTDGRRTQAAR